MARTRDISVEALRHKDKRRNIPTAELEPVMDEKDKTPIRLAYERRNRDLDPQLVWRGKGRAGLVRPDRPGAAALHPGEGTPKGPDRRSLAAEQRAAGAGDAANAGPLCRF
jgi:hypothetical protein